MFTWLYPPPPRLYFLLCLTPQFLLSPSLLDLLTVLLTHTFLFTIWVFSFSSLPPPFLPICPSYSLFSSSSAAECCSSYLCSRLGMFYLLMTSILSLPSITSCFLSGLPTCPCFLSVPLPPLIWATLVVSPGLGLARRQGRAMISSETGEEAIRGCCWGAFD